MIYYGVKFAAHMNVDRNIISISIYLRDLKGYNEQ